MWVCDMVARAHGMSWHAEGRPRATLMLDELTKKSALYHFEEVEDTVRRNSKRVEGLVRDHSDVVIKEVHAVGHRVSSVASQLEAKVRLGRCGTALTATSRPLAVLCARADGLGHGAMRGWHADSAPRSGVTACRLGVFSRP